MRRIIFAGVLVCSLAVLPISCTTEEKTAATEMLDDAKTPHVSLEADVAEVVKGNNEFAFDLYRQLAKQSKPGENIIFSPYSITTALAMTYGGAHGDTAEQMATVLHFSLGQKRLHPAIGHLLTDLNKDEKNRPYHLHVANALWNQQGLHLRERYVQLTRDNYAGSLKELDFAGQSEPSRKTINRWVEEQTKDKIKELLPAGSTGPETHLVLTNAIYFKATWKMPFPKDQTQDAPFQLTAIEKVTVPIMRGGRGIYNYFNGDDFQWLELPYKGDRLATVILLPQKKGRLAELEKTVTASTFQQGIGKLTPHSGIVAMPRFKMTKGSNLVDSLSRLGMVAPFASRADFSGITSGEGLYIANVSHKAFIDVDELGTEAAAATAVTKRIGSGSGVIYPEFALRADHPFLFLIRDKQTGSILFLGRLNDPRG